MAMMNAQQYRDSLARRKPLKVYLDGKLLADPQAQRVLIGRLAKVEEKKVYAKSLALNNSVETVEGAIRSGLGKLRAPKSAAAAAPVTA